MSPPKRQYGFVPYRSRVKNSSVQSYSGAMDVSDRGYGASLPLWSDNPYTSTDMLYRWRQYVALYEMSWEARKIVRIIPEDALRKDWIVEDIPEEMAHAIQVRLDELRFGTTLRKSLVLERLMGGSLTFLGIEDVTDSPSTPYQPEMGFKLRFTNAIPISRIARVDWCNDPLSPHYMRPEAYLINGEQVHISRALVWDGDPIIDSNDFALSNFRANIQGFGSSVLAPIWGDIIKAMGTRDAAYQLIQTNNAIIAAVSDLQDLMGTTSGKSALQKIKDVANQLSLYRAALLDAEKVQLSQHSASFGSVPELLITYLQVLSAASDIPATRFLGQAPGGLNATGESDLENYYNVIDSYQRQRIEPNLRRVYDILGWEMFNRQWGKLREKLTIKFPPLWNESELEQAQRNTITIDNVLKLLDARVITEEKAIDELNLKSALGVQLDQDDIALLSEFQSQPPESESGMPFGGPGQQQVMNDGGEWDEGKHKRAKDGKFGSGGGNGSGDQQKPEAKNKGGDDQKSKKEKAPPVDHTPEDKAAHAAAKERGLKVPPAWTNVWVNPDPNGALQVKGKDSKGRTQSIYSASFRDAQDAKKFKRVQKFSAMVPKIKEQIAKDVDSKPEAVVLQLISETGFRPGSNEDTKASKKAFGASTLTTDHVKLENGSVKFDFTGKKGVRQQHTVDDPKIVATIQKAMAGKGPGEPLFSTTDAKVREYMGKVAPGFKVYDFRTHIATATALQTIQSMDKPSDKKTLDKAVMAVCKKVSAKLGNSPAMAKASYIDPTVWKQWEV